MEAFRTKHNKLQAYSQNAQTFMLIQPHIPQEQLILGWFKGPLRGREDIAYLGEMRRETKRKGEGKGRGNTGNHVCWLLGGMAPWLF